MIGLHHDVTSGFRRIGRLRVRGQEVSGEPRITYIDLRLRPSLFSSLSTRHPTTLHYTPHNLSFQITAIWPLCPPTAAI